MGHFWEIFLGGDGMGLLTSAENLEKFGKIWKNAKIQGGDKVQTGGGQTFPKNFGGGPSLVIPPLLPRYVLSEINDFVKVFL